jgi:pyridoxamine 5'-phosphate oxidase
MTGPDDPTDPQLMQAPTGFHQDRPLDRSDLLEDPLAQFRRWLADAERAGVPLPNAMALATAAADGTPSARHVLLRGIDEAGFRFYTNHDSRKGREMAENPRAALVFLWKDLDRQVTVAGAVERLSDDESDAYFATRPRDAQLGAWASRQSEVLSDRVHLDERLEEAEAMFPDEVRRPPNWGGYLVRPATVEFWQGRRHRLHDRFRFTRRADASGWDVERLFP